MSGNRTNPITLSDDEDDVEVVDLTLDVHPRDDTEALELWLRGALYMCARLHENPDEADMEKELEQIILAFEAMIRSAIEALSDRNPAIQPQYADLIRGPRAELQRWFSQHGRKRDVRRVSEKGLLRLFKMMRRYVDENGWPREDAEGESIVLEFELEARIQGRG